MLLALNWLSLSVSLQVIAVVMCILFFYDIFMVFITPLITGVCVSVYVCVLYVYMCVCTVCVRCVCVCVCASVSYGVTPGILQNCVLYMCTCGGCLLVCSVPCMAIHQKC